MAGDLGMINEQARAQFYLSMVQGRTGHVDAALAGLLEAEAAFARQGNLVWRTRCALGRAALLAARGGRRRPGRGADAGAPRRARVRSAGAAQSAGRGERRAGSGATRSRSRGRGRRVGAPGAEPGRRAGRAVAAVRVALHPRAARCARSAQSERAYAAYWSSRRSARARARRVAARGAARFAGQRQDRRLPAARAAVPGTLGRSTRRCSTPSGPSRARSPSD